MSDIANLKSSKAYTEDDVKNYFSFTGQTGNRGMLRGLNNDHNMSGYRKMLDSLNKRQSGNYNYVTSGNRSFYSSQEIFHSNNPCSGSYE